MNTEANTTTRRTEVSVYLDTQEVLGNPEQPRQVFTKEHIDELADSISQIGQEQAGRVIPLEFITDLETAKYLSLPPEVKYLIISGESRYRACKQIGAEYKAVIVQKHMTRAEILVNALVENEQRKDPTPIENARAYQALVDSGLTVKEVSKLTGKRTQHIKDRLELLKINKIYQTSLEHGNITIGQAMQFARLSNSGQDALAKLIDGGKVKNVKDTTYAADAILQAEQQSSMFVLEELTPLDKQKQKAIKVLEQRLEKVYKLLLKYSTSGEFTILKKVKPSETEGLADKVNMLKRHLIILEKMLRETAVKYSVNTK